LPKTLLIDGIDLVAVGVGGKLRIGQDVVLQVSQIGKEDHPSVVTRTLGVTLLPYGVCFAGSWKAVQYARVTK
jgi:hypothetical protein